MDIHSLRRDGLSIRAIAKKLGIHRQTVKNHIAATTLPQYHTKKRRPSVLDPFRQIIKDYVEQDDYQATWIFDRLRKMGYVGSYETVRDFVRPLKEQQTRLAYIRFETEPGLQAQVDFGDYQIVEPDGTTTTVHAFSMLLGFSRAMYVEYVERCTMEAFMDCHINAFRYLGGVPAEILYDNMKNVVVDRSEGKANFNKEFLHFAHHYGFAAKACPPYSPWVKGKVERPMDYIRERFWRGYTFTTLQALNRDMRRWLDETANRRVHGTHHRPVCDRWQQESSLLGKLPPTDYDTSIKVYRKVYKDCQISYNTNRYLVPHRVVGKRVLLKIKHGVIAIFHDHDFLVSYQEAGGKHEFVGNRLFYDQLRRDQQQLTRKYGKGKGKATRGLTSGSLYPQVEQRPLAEYDLFAQGGVAWNN
ncbi:IS21 family transposase [Thiovibrio sp. JS02]